MRLPETVNRAMMPKAMATARRATCARTSGELPAVTLAKIGAVEIGLMMAKKPVTIAPKRVQSMRPFILDATSLATVGAPQNKPGRTP